MMHTGCNRVLDSSTGQRKGSVSETATTHALAVSLKRTISSQQGAAIQANNNAYTCMHMNCPSCLPNCPGYTRGAAGTTSVYATRCLQPRLKEQQCSQTRVSGRHGLLLHHPLVSLSRPPHALFTRSPPSCTPGGALARLASGSKLSRNAHAGTRPRSAACADSARAGQTSLCTCSSHTTQAAWSSCCLYTVESAQHAANRSMNLQISELQEHGRDGVCQRYQGVTLQPVARLGLQQRPACPASSSARASSCSAATLSGGACTAARKSCVAASLSSSPRSCVWNQHAYGTSTWFLRHGSGLCPACTCTGMQVKP